MLNVNLNTDFFYELSLKSSKYCIPCSEKLVALFKLFPFENRYIEVKTDDHIMTIITVVAKPE